MRRVVLLLLIIILFPCVSVQAHTPNIMMSILKEDGPAPMNIVETAGFVEGDGLKFKVGDSTDNASMRVSIDLNGDGIFNQSDDYFTPWMVYDCQHDDNGTLDDPECVESVVFYFNGSNGSGTYDYRVEKIVGGKANNSWNNSIFVGVDNHQESTLPIIGDCFGIGCQDDVELVVESDNEGENKNLISLLIVISTIGLIVVSLSILFEKNSEEE